MLWREVLILAESIRTKVSILEKKYNKNVVIAKNIDILSGSALKLNLEKAEEFELMEPLYKDKPKPNHQNKSGKGGGKSQNRRRR